MKRFYQYEYLKSENIVCIVIETSWRWPIIQATGCGDYPCIIIELQTKDKNGNFKIKEIPFKEYDHEWSVFCASSEKHGINVVLTKTNKD